MVARTDISLEKGTAQPFAFRLANGDGAPMDLTDFSAQLLARRRTGDADVVFSLQSPDDIEIDVSKSRVAVTFGEAVVSSLSIGVLYYDLLLTPPAGERLPIFEGRIVVRG